MFFAMMHNKLDKIAEGECLSHDLFDAQAVPFARDAKRKASTALAGEADAIPHVQVRLRDLPGYKGSAQQWCVVCGMKITFCCIACSNKDYVLPIHPTKNKGKHFKCLDIHQADTSKHIGVRPTTEHAGKKHHKQQAGEAIEDSPAKNTRSCTSARAERSSFEKRKPTRSRFATLLETCGTTGARQKLHLLPWMKLSLMQRLVRRMKTMIELPS